MEPTIMGKPVSWWEGYLRELSNDDEWFRGIRIEPPIDHDRMMVWRSWLPQNPWLGLHANGQRITLRDIGWVV